VRLVVIRAALQQIGRFLVGRPCLAAPGATHDQPAGGVDVIAV
jgi:hypothetical protein